MCELNDQELLKIEGGSIKIGAVGAIIVGGIVFIIGLLNGLTRPYSCSSNK